jgi:hypothetical protein
MLVLVTQILSFESDVLTSHHWCVCFLNVGQRPEGLEQRRYFAEEPYPNAMDRSSVDDLHQSYPQRFQGGLGRPMVSHDSRVVFDNIIPLQAQSHPLK